MVQRWPDFFVLGAQKAGTTTMFDYFASHPGVYVPMQKEAHFFTYWPGPDPATKQLADRSHIASIDEYLALFAGAAEGQIIGDVSPSYLYGPYVPGRIARYCPGAKLIAILRNPVDRAFSNYLHCVRTGRENLSFEDALAIEGTRIEDGWDYIWHYSAKSRYAEQLKRYLRFFKREQLCVVIFEEFVRNPAEAWADLSRFLQIESFMEIDMQRISNRARIGRTRTLRRILPVLEKRVAPFKRYIPKKIKILIKEGLFKRPQLTPRERKALMQQYTSDIEELEQLLGRTLNVWKSGS